MSTIANAKGGLLKTLTISRTASSDSITTLRDDFIKKTSNYVCQIPQFIMNNATKLSLVDEVMFEIRPKGNEDQDATALVFPVPWQTSSYQFKPRPYRTWVELARQMERFFHRFGVIAELIGFPGVNRIQPAGGFPYTNVEIPGEVESYEDLEAHNELDNPEGRHIAFTLDDDGRFTLEFDFWFSTYFYLKLGPQTQIKTGFPEYMFVLTDEGTGVTKTHQDGLDALFDVVQLNVGNYIFTEDVDTAIQQKRKFTSTFSLETFDDRLSIDCIATFPISSRISALNGKEQRDFLLARFAIGDYEQNSSEVMISQGRLQNVNVMKEVLKIGLEDLTNSNPDYTSIFLLPGKIRHVNIKLVTRYMSEGKIVEVPTDMRDGTWVLKLLFSKKVT